MAFVGRLGGYMCNTSVPSVTPRGLFQKGQWDTYQAGYALSLRSDLIDSEGNLGVASVSNRVFGRRAPTLVGV